jgi:hypothetical protein
MRGRGLVTLLTLSVVLSLLYQRFTAQNIERTKQAKRFKTKGNTYFEK